MSVLHLFILGISELLLLFFHFCRWITPVLLLIDFYEKMAVSSKRRAQMNKVCVKVCFLFKVISGVEMKYPNLLKMFPSSVPSAEWK